MATTHDVVSSHYASRERLVAATAAAGASLWAGLDDYNLTASWAARLAQLQRLVDAAQMRAALAANDYVADVLDAQGIRATPLAEVRADAMSGIASDGRPLRSLLMRPIVSVLRSLRQGNPLSLAKSHGRFTLDRIVRTQVADAGRVADGVAVAATPQIGYVRFVNPPACSRCLILAGRYYRWSAGFLRHPQCDCLHVPSRGADAAEREGLVADPKKYFNSLTREQQDRVFTKDGARAIRDGADMNQVVNARRGMKKAGGRVRTTEGTTRRGIAGSRLSGAQRLMPEEIYALAGSRDEAVTLLRANGFVI